MSNGLRSGEWKGHEIGPPQRIHLFGKWAFSQCHTALLRCGCTVSLDYINRSLKMQRSNVFQHIQILIFNIFYVKNNGSVAPVLVSICYTFQKCLLIDGIIKFCILYFFFHIIYTRTKPYTVLPRVNITVESWFEISWSKIFLQFCIHFLWSSKSPV